MADEHNAFHAEFLQHSHLKHANKASLLNTKLKGVPSLSLNTYKAKNKNKDDFQR